MGGYDPPYQLCGNDGNLNIQGYETQLLPYVDNKLWSFRIFACFAVMLCGFIIAVCGLVIMFCGFRITLGDFRITLPGFGITLCGFGITLCGFAIKLGYVVL